MRQFGTIMGVTCAGEILKFYVDLPIPASIYGLIIMLLLLVTGIVKVDNVKDVATFLIEIMPLMFIPAAVGLLTSWDQLQSILVPVCIITVVTTIIVMVVSGKVTDFALKLGGKKDE